MMKAILKPGCIILEPEQNEQEMMEKMFPAGSKKVLRQEKTDPYGVPTGGHFYKLTASRPRTEVVADAST
jgi:hypothetical protein